MDRFWSKVQREQGGCWIWIGAKNANGYGRFWYDRRVMVAHRVAYLMLVGQVPEGKDLDHLCRIRACVNPEHLEPVSRDTNLKRGIGHGSESHCPSGHSYSGYNLIRQGSSRRCRICRNNQHREYMRAKRVKARACEVLHECTAGMTAAVHDEQKTAADQARDALRHANDVRVRRAQLKRDIGAGRVTVASVLLDPPEYAAAMRVLDLLLAVPYVGRSRAGTALNGCGVSALRSVGGLSERQRVVLAGLLAERGRA